MSQRFAGEAPTPGRPKPKKKRRRFWRWVGYTFLFFVLVGLGVAGYVGKYVYDQYQVVKSIKLDTGFDWDLSTVVYDRNGKEIRKLHSGEDRIFVPLREIPSHVQDAVVAIEDARFWDHLGIDPYRMLGAAWNDVKYLVKKEGNIQGASTVTQQLARNAFLTLDQKPSRKVQEIILAIQMEMQFSKQEILEKYLNEIFFGDNYYGIAAAAKGFFGKDARNLTLAEGAMLAGLIQWPTYYNPYDNMEAARERQAVVLSQMVRYGFITQAQADEAKAQRLTLPGRATAAARKAVNYTGAHYVDYVIDVLTKPALAEQYGITPFDEVQLFRGGYKIYVAMDPALQTIADEGVATVMDPKFLAKKEINFKPEAVAWNPDKPEENIQAAAVVMNPKTGEVLALVGGRTHTQDRELNRATSITRQPGSTFKPLAVYTPAFELLGYSPGTVIDDAPLMFVKETNKMWPENFEHNYQGLVPLRWAVEQSRNAVAVQVMNRVGASRAFDVATKLGIRSLVPSGPRNDVNLSMGLGGLTNGVSLLEMTAAYATIANMGMRVDPVVVTRIVDRHGTVVYEAKPAHRQVIKDTSAWLMIDTLKGVVQRGTAAYFTDNKFKVWPTGGKTGTTEENVDAWFMGFTPDLVTGIWNGYDNRTTPRYLPYTGAFVPVMTWNEIMVRAVKDKPQDWQRPPGVIAVEICEKTGLLPSPTCPKKRTEWFTRGTEPREFDFKFWTQPTEAVREKVKLEGGVEGEVWKLWQAGCTGTPLTRPFLIRPEFARHPTNPYNKLWVPADLAETLSDQKCTVTGPVPPPAAPPPGVAVPGQPTAPGAPIGTGTGEQPGVRGIPGIFVVPEPAKQP